MPAGLSPTEEFIALFNNLKAAAGNTPERVPRCYKDSEAIRDAVHALLDFLARTDLERRVFHGRKVVMPRAAGFENAWKEYYAKWRFKVIWPKATKEALVLDLGALLDALTADAEPDHSTAQYERAWKGEQVEAEPLPMGNEPKRPDPETEASFDPLRHDGGAAIELGITELQSRVDDGWDQAQRNSCSIA